VALYEGGERGRLDSYLYEAGPGTRQHVDLRSTVLCMGVSGSGRRASSREHRTALACSPTSCWRCGPLYNIIE